MRLRNRIKEQVDNAETNPHALHLETGVTYRILHRLYNEDEIPDRTSIGTLARIAESLGLRVDDLFTAED